MNNYITLYSTGQYPLFVNGPGLESLSGVRLTCLNYPWLSSILWSKCWYRNFKIPHDHSRRYQFLINNSSTIRCINLSSSKSIVKQPINKSSFICFNPCLKCCIDRFCGLVVTVSGYRSRGSGFDSWRFQIFWEATGLERGPFSLMRTTEELLEGKVAAPV
jgi:hypothetical protein